MSDQSSKVRICVDFKAAKQNQLREQAIGNEDQGYKHISYDELYEIILNKLTSLQNQNQYLEILIEVKDSLEQDAQKFEFSSKISQLKSCMKKSKDLEEFIKKNKSNIDLVMKKIKDNFDIVESNNEIKLLEELEISRKMNRKYEKLIEKHLQQAKIAENILSEVEKHPYYSEILQNKSVEISIDLSNPQMNNIFQDTKQQLDLYAYCHPSQDLFTKKVKALGAGLARNNDIIELNLNLFGTGINSSRLQAISNGLAKNRKIRKLDLNLGGNMINQSDIQILNAFLVQNSTVEELNLNLKYNNILGAGLKDIGFGLQKNKHLKSIKLNVEENDISKRGHKLFQSFIKNSNQKIETILNYGIESPSYSIYKQFHLQRISSVLEIILKNQLQIQFESLLSF